VITKVGKGSRTRGLVEYLFGPGRSEEHTNQRIVGAWDPAWVGITHPDGVQRGLLTAELETPLRRAALAGEHPADRHVYHVSISNHSGDRNLSDDEWRTVAEAVADKLGFTGTATRAGVRWIAVHHGAASDDRDHIHFQATLVRDDGTPVHLANDYRALREVAKEMRAEFGLDVRTREPGAGRPGLSRLEVQTQRRTDAAAGAAPAPPAAPKRVAMPNQEQLDAERRRRRTQALAGQPRPHAELPRYRLARAVRAAAAAADTEAQWLARLGELGVQVAPRWERGGQRVVGYSVALDPTHPAHPGGDPVWFGGGKLDHDLTLPALRAGWRTDHSTAAAWWALQGAPSPTAAVATPRQGPAVERTPEQHEQTLAGAAYTIGDAADSVEVLTPNSHGAGWAQAARDTAGLLAALAEHAPAEYSRAIAEASADMTRAGQVPHRQPRGARGLLGTEFLAVASTVLAAGSNTKYSTDILLAQVLRLSRTIAAANEAEGRVLAARHASAAVGLLQAATAPPPAVPAPPTRVAMPNQQQLDAERAGTRRRAPHRGAAHDDDPGPVGPGLPTETDRGLGR